MGKACYGLLENGIRVKKGGEMLTKEEILKIRAGLGPWPNTSAPKRPASPSQSENKRVAG